MRPDIIVFCASLLHCILMQCLFQLRKLPAFDFSVMYVTLLTAISTLTAIRPDCARD